MECFIKQKKSTRSSKGCWTCRNRKIRCDLKRESCNNCLNSNLKCEGYYSKLNWYELQTISHNSSINKPKVIKMPTLNSRSFVPFVNWGIQQYHFEEVLDNDIHFNLGPFNSWQLNAHDNNEKLLTLNMLSENNDQKKSNIKGDRSYQHNSENYIESIKTDSNRVQSWIDFSLFDNYLISKTFEECKFLYILYLNKNIVDEENETNIEENNKDEAPDLLSSVSYFVENFIDCHDLIFDIFQNEIIFKIARFRNSQDFDSIWFRIFQNWIIKNIDLDLLLENLLQIRSSGKISEKANDTMPTLFGFQIIMISNYYKFLKSKEKRNLVFAIHVKNILSKVGVSQLTERLLSKSGKYILDIFIYELLKIHFDSILALNIQFADCFNPYVVLMSNIETKKLDESFFFPNDRLLFHDICEYFEALILLYDTTSTISDSKKLNFTTQLRSHKLMKKFVKDTSSYLNSENNMTDSMDPIPRNFVATQDEGKKQSQNNNVIEVSSFCQPPTLNEVLRPRILSKINKKDDAATAGSGDIHYDYEYNDEIDDPIPPELEIKFTFGSDSDCTKYSKSDEEMKLQLNALNDHKSTLILKNEVTSNLEQNLCDFPSCLLFDFQYRIVCLLQRYKNYHIETHEKLNTIENCNTRNNVIYQYHDSMDIVSCLEKDLESWNCFWNLRSSSTVKNGKSMNNALHFNECNYGFAEKEFHSEKRMSYYMKTKIFYDGLILLFFTQIKDMPEDCLTPYIKEILQLASYNLDEDAKSGDCTINKFFLFNSSMFLSLPVFLAASELGNFDCPNDYAAYEDAKKSQAELQMKTKSEIFDKIILSYWKGDVLYCNWKAIQTIYEIWRIRSQNFNAASNEEKVEVSWDLVLRELGFLILLL